MNSANDRLDAQSPFLARGSGQGGERDCIRYFFHGNTTISGERAGVGYFFRADVTLSDLSGGIAACLSGGGICRLFFLKVLKLVHHDIALGEVGHNPQFPTQAPPRSDARHRSTQAFLALLAAWREEILVPADGRAGFIRFIGVHPRFRCPCLSVLCLPSSGRHPLRSAYRLCNSGKGKTPPSEKFFTPLGAGSCAIIERGPCTEFRHDSCNTAPR